MLNSRSYFKNIETIEFQVHFTSSQIGAFLVYFSNRNILQIVISYGNSNLKIEQKPFQYLVLFERETNLN